MNLRFLLACVLGCGICVGSCQAQSSDYQSAKIVAVEKLPSQDTGTGGTDAPSSSTVGRHNVSIKLNDTLYVCRVKTHSDIDLDGNIGKDVLAKVNKNVLYVKNANGKVTKLSIVSKKPD